MAKNNVEERLAVHDKRLDRHDKQIAAIRGLLEQGIRMMVETRKVLRDIAIGQKRTDAKVEQMAESIKALTDSLRRTGGNGHPKRKIDLQ